MAKVRRSVERGELAPAESLRPGNAPQAISNARRSASSVVAFVVAAAFGLTVGGAFASEAGILPPLGGEEATILVDESPSAPTDPTPDPSQSPEEVPTADPSPRDDDDEDDDREEDEDEDEDEDEEEDEDEDEDEDDVDDEDDDEGEDD